MSEKVVQLYDKDGNNIFPITSFEAMSGGEVLSNTFVQKSGDIMTGNLKVPNLNIANDICRGFIYGETNSLIFRGGNPTTEKYTYLKIAEDGVYIDNQKIYYPGNKPTPADIGVYSKIETDTFLQKKADKDRIVNPNLLDNWYFGNPVDQRGGYVVKPGTPYFSNHEGTSLAGYTDAYYQVLFLSDGEKIKVNDTEYYVDIRMAVRGYTGFGYTIDRWRQQADGTVLINQDGLQFNGTSYVATYLDFNALSYLLGKQVTLSVLYKNALSGKQVAADWCDYDQNTALVTSGSEGLAQATFTIPSDTTEFRYIIGANTPEQTKEWYTIQAIKLELGDTQTLAHQDENGNWVLNEIPNYGEQLRRCMRYFQVITNGTLVGDLYSTTMGRVYYKFPVTMRNNPSIIMNPKNLTLFGHSPANGVNTIALSSGTHHATVDGFDVDFYVSGNGTFVNPGYGIVINTIGANTTNNEPICWVTAEL